MARPRITSIIAKWLFGESTTSGEKSTLRASLGAAPSSNIPPESINGTAATITGNNIFSGDNTFNGTVVFTNYTTFNGAVTFTEAVNIQNLSLKNASNPSNYVLFDVSSLDDQYDQTLASSAGTIPTVPSYPNVDDANESLAAGDFFWDTTLKKLRVATA